MNRSSIIIASLALGLGLASCGQYLDKYPDNRMELHSPSDAAKFLVSAYPEGHPAYLLEMYSDNTDEQDYTNWSANSPFQEQAYRWADITEIREQETPQQLWDAHYTAVTVCNEVLKHISEAKNKDEYSAQVAEAKLCRAYAMFQLANVFCQAYAPETAAKDLGLPYPEEPEVHPGRVLYKRGTLEQLYKRIEQDLTKGLAGLANAQYSQPKYHFTAQAAHAFAARFYLYARQYAKAIEHADATLGSNPATNLRDWAAWSKTGLSGNVQPNAFVQSSVKANILLQAVATEWGGLSIPILRGSKYAHGALISTTETLQTDGPWGASGDVLNYTVVNNNGVSKYAIRKLPYTAKYVDRVAGIGIPYSAYTIFTTDETLMVRAEAKALLGRYEEALADLNLELSVFSKKGVKLTLQGIQDFYKGVKYYTPEHPTPRKELHVTPALEATTQEPLLQAILQLRRILTIHEGLRMQDIKRYGITIYRRRVNVSNVVEAVTDKMEARDPRLAIQIPQDVISAQLEPNPRNGAKTN